MERILLTSRITNIIALARLQWIRDCRVLVRSENAKKVARGPRLAEQGMEAFERAMDAAVAKALEEIAKNVSRPSRHWRWAHVECRRLFRDLLREVPEENAIQLYRGSNAETGRCPTHYDMVMSGIEGAITLHEAGWTAPTLEPWIKRNAYWISLAISTAALGTAIFRDDIRDWTLGPTHQAPPPGIMSQPSQGTEAPPPES